MRLSWLTLAFLVALFPGGAAGEPTPQVPDDVTAGIAAGKGSSQVYIVQMELDPVIAYDGDDTGYAATRPERGQRLNRNSVAAQRYAAHLDARHDSALQAVGAAAQKLYDYRYSFNGFAAVLTPAQARALRSRDDVLRVSRDQLRFPTTDNSPSFLGLTDPVSGLHSLGVLGEDVIVGVIDTGAWPENPSFSDQVDLADRPGASGKLSKAYGPPPAHWHGTCQSGELWSQEDCNNKLIGARYYQRGFGAGGSGLLLEEYLSARDADGHGSHTASTAAGNANAPADPLGTDRGTRTGMAPRARVAIYKACWNDAGCANSDLVAAIDDAVADGVDVINYSIGSGSTSLVTPDSVAFLFAADVGVFVATSAGNAGPGSSSIGDPALVPWLTTVGASTQDRTFRGSTVQGDGSEYFGASLTQGTGELTLVDSEDVGSELCIPGDLDPGAVAGRIVLCRRGEIARVDKSRAVAMAGGAGTILYNASDTETQNVDPHHTPAVHINNTDGMAIKAYIDAAGSAATARINGGDFTAIPAPDMASFSSRGPNGGSLDILKPDVTAPGVNILAATTPTPFLGAPGQSTGPLSGTSMSSPHVAGIAALLKEAQPSWTPAMIKSALMTTAYTDVLKEDGVTPADPFDIGAGHVDPNPAIDPGLTYGAGFLDYLAFLCGASSAVSPATCDFLESLGFSLDPSDLNLPSIAIGDLAGFQTVTRSVRNVGDSTATYTVSVSAPPGHDVAVSPSSITLDPGASQAYEVTITNLSAPVDVWAFGSLTWSHGPHHVRSPIVVRPIAIAAPGEVFGAGTDGTASFDVVFGYTGDYTAGNHGLVEPSTQDRSVADDPANDINTALDTCDFDAPFPYPCTGLTWHEVPVDPGTAFLRVSLFDEYTDGNDDLDLYVFDSGLGLVGGSGSPTSAEEVNVVLPGETVYLVAVHGWGTDGPDASYTLFNWSVPLSTGGSLMIDAAPAAATLGTTGSVDVSWSALDAGKKYLGAVSHSDATGLIGLTLINVDTH